MKYTVYCEPDDFEFWGGAKSRMAGATDVQKAAVYERLEEYTDGGIDVTETDINDLVWFECDDIFYSEAENEN